MSNVVTLPFEFSEAMYLRLNELLDKVETLNTAEQDELYWFYCWIFGTLLQDYRINKNVPRPTNAKIHCECKHALRFLFISDTDFKCVHPNVPLLCKKPFNLLNSLPPSKLDGKKVNTLFSINSNFNNQKTQRTNDQ